MGIITSLYNYKPMLNLVKKLQEPISNHNTTGIKLIKTHFSPFIGVLAGGTYLYNINKSKKIPEERKMPLTLNTIICSTIGVISGYLVQPHVDSFAEALTDRAIKIYEKDKALLTDTKKIEALNSIISTVKNGIKSAVPVIIFALTLRFLSPVFATPLADKLTKYLTQKGLIKNNSKDNKQSEPQDYNRMDTPIFLPSSNITEARFLGNSFRYEKNVSSVDQNFNRFLNKVNYLI